RRRDQGDWWISASLRAPDGAVRGWHSYGYATARQAMVAGSGLLPAAERGSPQPEDLMASADTTREAVERLAAERDAKAAESRVFLQAMLDHDRHDHAAGWRMAAEQAET